MEREEWQGATDADGIDDVVVAVCVCVCSPVCCHHHLVLCRTVIKEVKNLDPKNAGKSVEKGKASAEQGGRAAWHCGAVWLALCDSRVDIYFDFSSSAMRGQLSACHSSTIYIVSVTVSALPFPILLPSLLSPHSFLSSTFPAAALSLCSRQLQPVARLMLMCIQLSCVKNLSTRVALFFCRVVAQHKSQRN